MKKDIISIKNTNLKDFDFNGTFLFENEGESYFYYRFYNCIFYVDENYKTSEKISENLKIDFENYILKFCELCNISKTKPSLIFFNKILPFDKINEILNNEYENITDENDLKKLCSQPSFYYENNNENIENIIGKLVETRSREIPNNNIFIVLNKPEEIKIKYLMHIVTVSRSRNIYFLIFNFDKKKFEETYDEFEVETIFMNCKNYFVCDNNKIFEFRYHTYENCLKFKSQKFSNKNLNCKFKKFEKLGSLVCLKFKDAENKKLITQLDILENELKDFTKLIPANEDSIKKSMKFFGKGVPTEVSSLYQKYNGGIIFDNLKLFSTLKKFNDEFKDLKNLKKINKNSKFKIFAEDKNGVLIGFEPKDFSEKIYFINKDGNYIKSMNCLSDYLKEIIKEFKINKK